MNFSEEKVHLIYSRINNLRYFCFVLVLYMYCLPFKEWLDMVKVQIICQDNITTFAKIYSTKIKYQ